MNCCRKNNVLCFRSNTVTDKKLERLIEEFGDTRSAILRLAVAAFFELVFNRNLSVGVEEFSSAEQHEQ